MAAFNYQALDAQGKVVKGVIEGDSERHVRSILRSRQLKPLDVTGTRKRNQEGSAPRLGFGQPRLNYRDVALVTRQLASLVQSGLPLDEVLRATATQSRKPAIKTLMLQVRSRVLEGLSLAQAMAEAPKAFDNLYRAMVRAGESAGFLGPVLEQLADYTERSQATRQKMQMALMYPVILLGVSITVIVLLMAFVVPKLVGLFEHNRQSLPFLTQALIATSDFVVNYGVFVIIGLVGLVFLFRRLLQAPERQLRWHRFLLRVPFVGELILQAETARYASTLGLLVESGVPLLEALRIAGQVLTNRELQQASKGVAIAVKEGTSLNRALDQADVFPPLLVQMAASGEANGKLADQLLHAARNQERELEFRVGTVMGFMEPVMVLFMGAIVTTIVMAILMPIFELNDMVG
jgi:general secretion pathway protein F